MHSVYSPFNAAISDGGRCRRFLPGLWDEKKKMVAARYRLCAHSAEQQSAAQAQVCCTDELGAHSNVSQGVHNFTTPAVLGG